MEESQNLYKRNIGGVNYWEAVRTEIYYSVFYNYFNIKISGQTEIVKSKSIVRKLKGLLNFIYVLAIKREKVIFFSASRNLTYSKKNFDINLDDLINTIDKNNRIVFETFSKNEITIYDSVIDYGMSIYTKFNRKFGVNQKLVFGLNEIFDQQFELNIDLDDIASTSFSNYKSQLKYYSWLFGFLRPKAIIMIQNGIQKGMFEAANCLDIPIIEVQHGLIGRYHPSYSYPEFVKKFKLKTLPRYFLSYSDFWTRDIYFPVKNCLPIGNSKMHLDSVCLVKEFEITILYSDGYLSKLDPFIERLLIIGFCRKICIKLHPSLFKHYEQIAERFKNYDFIRVVSNQRSIENILSVSKSILVIQSTVVYQALDRGIGVFLLKEMDYEIHADVFYNPCVKLIDSADQLVVNLNSWNTRVSEPVCKFFKEFDKALFIDFLKKENIEID